MSLGFTESVIVERSWKKYKSITPTRIRMIIGAIKTAFPPLPIACDKEEKLGKCIAETMPVNIDVIPPKEDPFSLEASLAILLREYCSSACCGSGSRIFACGLSEKACVAC